MGSYRNQTSRITMKLLLLILSLVAAALAGNSYTYLTYFSDSNCDRFVATRGLTDQNGPYFSASGSTCQEEMQCLLNPSSSQCAAVAVEAKEIRIVPLGNGLIDEYVNDGTPERFEYGSCTKSNSFSNCYFSYYSTSQVVEFFEDGGSSLSNSSAGIVVVPSVLLALVMMLFA